ncbi:MAG TPA: metalloregulator ArsR/SmtB family transcription factor [Methanobacteriaceae archaeon]|nr:metalloregulator ArsR/SmtB family transcription factor [Methanobacteriaceae archaeon]
MTALVPERVVVVRKLVVGINMNCNEEKCRPNPEQIKNITQLLDDLPSEENLFQDSELIKALSDVTRLKILHLLRGGELCVCEIMYALEKPQSTVSHHLNVLKSAGLIKWRKEGIWNHYQLMDPELVENLERLTKFFQSRRF